MTTRSNQPIMLQNLENDFMKAEFYKLDSYLEMRRKFTGAWANLRLELNRQTPKFYHEGFDEFENETVFYPPETINELLFTLTGETTKAAARKLFAEHYSYRRKPGDWIEAAIEGNFLHEFSYPSEVDTLDECNNPFYLPLNEYIYAEFKRRFRKRWTNLSVEIYRVKNSSGEPQELREDFEMKTLMCVNRLLMGGYYERDGVRNVIEKRVNEHVLRDETYLSDLANTLAQKGITFQIKNRRLGIYWNRDLSWWRLRDFQEAKNE